VDTVVLVAVIPGWTEFIAFVGANSLSGTECGATAGGLTTGCVVYRAQNGNESCK